MVAEKLLRDPHSSLNWFNVLSSLRVDSFCVQHDLQNMRFERIKHKQVRHLLVLILFGEL